MTRLPVWSLSAPGAALTSVDQPETVPSDIDVVQAAYGSWAAVYIERFGTADKASPEDRAVIAQWAGTVEGAVLDAGCGPGHWSAYLRDLGRRVEGIDATPSFVSHAARAYPDIPFRLGDLRTIDLAAGSLGGVLAWFSLIHLDPSEVPGVLQRFATALRPGGTILVGFFSGETLQPFDHRVTTAWAWPPALLGESMERAGLETVGWNEHRQPSGRVFAELEARKPR